MRTLVAFFEDTVGAGEAVTAIVAAGIVPGAIEMMDRLSIDAAEQATGAGYRLDAGAALLVELDGPRDECTARFEHLMELCAQAGALDVRVALNEEERALMWQTRKAAFAAMGRIAPAYYVQDGVIPRTRLPRCSAGSTRSPPSTGSRSPTSSTPATATCIRSSATTRPRRRRGGPGRGARGADHQGLRRRRRLDHRRARRRVDKKAYMPAMFSETDLDDVPAAALRVRSATASRTPAR